MAGGLMNLVSEGQQNIMLNGNPSKTFWKTTYAHYTNFGLQKFRVDFDGARTLRLSEPSTFIFKIPRYAELLLDCYVSVNLPHIWSPIIPPVTDPELPGYNEGRWIPYEYKWIRNLGAQMIGKITITCGNQTLQEFSGNYLYNMVQRDFSEVKKNLFDEMSGNVKELYDPGNSGTRVNSYPNAVYTTDPNGAEPSIRGRTLYIPLNTWFSLKSQMAFPLVALQYNELQIHITFRPIQELFQIRDVFDVINNYPYIAPNFNKSYMQFHRFMQTPPENPLTDGAFIDNGKIWNADIHLNCTYGFLSDEESRYFALKEQKYLFRQIRETIFYNVTGPNKVDLNSLGMVSSFMFYLQRSDANLRNEWSNYSNWPYTYLPNDILQCPTNGTYPINRSGTIVRIGPGVNSDGTLTGWLFTGDYSIENEKDILVQMGLLLDGSYRENTQPPGVFNYIEKYTRTPGNAPSGLYCYNFCLNTSPYDMQPSGAINMNRFNQIELEINTITPPLDPLAQSMAICDPATGEIIGVNKSSWNIYQYNFNLNYFEERLNIISFISGNAGLMYAT